MAGADRVAEAEAWFVAHGLPYFVDDIRDSVRVRLRRPRLMLVATGALVLGCAAGIGVGLGSDEGATGVSTGTTVALVILLLYAIRALKGWLIARWALGRAFHSLGLLFPLATRALPMLLLFVTFLFINTEVWQVASELRGGVLWTVVMLFGAVAVGFLLARLAEELDAFDDAVDAAQLVASCAGTPFEGAARDLVAAGEDPDAEVTGLQKANLVLVLLIAQAVQVLLLSVAVFCFFIVFGVVAVDETVVESWLGRDATYPPGVELVSRELTQVSIFLAAFSGLYFTVYAVTDANYRQQFFTAITRELELAVNARVAYRRLRSGA